MKMLAESLVRWQGVVMTNRTPTMTETLAALALCADACWEPASRELLADEGLDYASIAQPIEIGYIRQDGDGSLQKIAVRWTEPMAGGARQVIEIITTTTEEQVEVMHIALNAEVIS